MAATLESDGNNDWGSSLSCPEWVRLIGVIIDGWEIRVLRWGSVGDSPMEVGPLHTVVALHGQ